MATHADTIQADAATGAVPAFRAPTESTPPLESGDRLSREEFNRRWEAMPQLRHAELIFGVVYLQAPISVSFHGDPHGLIIIWLGHYSVATPGTICGGNTTVLLGSDSQPEPDANLRIAPTHGGQWRLSPKGYIDGAPEFVAEIAASSASYDLHDKLELYRQHGVREYLVWRAYDREIDWFILRDGAYAPLPPGADGVLRSEFFPGLWLDRAALLAGNLAEAIRVLQVGLATAKHAEFAERLSKAAQPKPA